MDKKEFEKTIKEYLDVIEMDLKSEQIEQLYTYMNELLEWNEKINLTAITEPKEVILKHFVDSLIINKYLKGESLIDVGTGGGFPGIPAKIKSAELKVLLLDSLNKRINFLNNAIEKLGLTHIEAIHSRAEELGIKEEYREKFDNVVSRAVANLNVLCEYMIPFAKVGGQCICMKGQIEEELEEAKSKIELLGGKIVKVERYTLPLTDMERTIIVIEKVKETPKKYPRKPGQIKK